MTNGISVKRQHLSGGAANRFYSKLELADARWSRLGCNQNGTQVKISVIEVKCRGIVFFTVLTFSRDYFCVATALVSETNDISFFDVGAIFNVIEGEYMATTFGNENKMLGDQLVLFVQCGSWNGIR